MTSPRFSQRMSRRRFLQAASGSAVLTAAWAWGVPRPGRLGSGPNRPAFAAWGQDDLLLGDLTAPFAAL
jgi:hypothetical protein